MLTRRTLWENSICCDNVRTIICLRFAGYRPQNLPEIIENLEEMFPRYYMHSDVYSRLIHSTTQYGVLLAAKGLTPPSASFNLFLVHDIMIYHRHKTHFFKIFKKFWNVHFRILQKCIYIILLIVEPSAVFFLVYYKQ